MESDDFRVKEEDLVRPFKIKANGVEDFQVKLDDETKKQFITKGIESMVDPTFQPLLKVLSGK